MKKMKTKEYIRSLTAEQLRSNAAVKAVLEAKLPVGSRTGEDEDGTFSVPLGPDTLKERFFALCQKGGGWQYGTIWNDLFEAVGKSPIPGPGERITSFVLRGVFLHRVLVRSIDKAPAGYTLIKEIPHPSYGGETLRFFERRYPVSELLIDSWKGLRRQVHDFKVLRREFVGLLDQLPFGLRPGPDANQICELQSFALPWARKAVADYQAGRWPENPVRNYLAEVPDWLTYRCMNLGGGHSASPWHHLVPVQVRRILCTEISASDPREEVFTRLQEAGVAISLWFDGETMAVERARAMEIIVAYKAEQISEFERGSRYGKRAFRQDKHADGHSPKGGNIHDRPLKSQFWGSAHDEGYARGFREARERFVAKVVRNYIVLGAGNSCANRMAGFAACPNWRANLSGWFGMTKWLLKRGVAVKAVQSLGTSFVRWEVGGTYRHRSLIMCDPEKARQLLEGVPSDRMSPQGGPVVRNLFGCTEKSRAGFIFHPDGVEVYADQ
jgi:hypothetical protein